MADARQISQWVDDALASTPVYDIHTHLYPPNFGPLMLWGIDELLTYHYLIGESIRASGIAYERFWGMSKPEQANFIWQTLFVERAPISEACRGVVTVIRRLGLDPNSKNVEGFREFFATQSPQGYVDRVLKVAHVHTVTMTNDPLDPVERAIWLSNPERDPRFKAVLRIDPVLLGWPEVGQALSSLGFAAGADLGAGSMAEIRRFLTEWIERIDAQYVAVSLPPTWRYPADDACTRVLNEAVLPVCAERELAFAMMIGVTRQANPQLRLAGDSLGKADITSVERICAAHPRNKFLCTMLSRENQHELAVTGRLFPNLMVFGCWWYVNNPSLIEEITAMRMELLGPTFIPQHSDARILDQLIYKWEHSRAIIGSVLKTKFTDLANAGWKVSQDEVRRTVASFLSDNFTQFLSR